MQRKRGDTTAHNAAAKFKKDKDPEGERGRANDRLTIPSVSAREGEEKFFFLKEIHRISCGREPHEFMNALSVRSKVLRILPLCNQKCGTLGFVGDLQSALKACFKTRHSKSDGGGGERGQGGAGKHVPTLLLQGLERERERRRMPEGGKACAVCFHSAPRPAMLNTDVRISLCCFSQRSLQSCKVCLGQQLLLFISSTELFVHPWGVSQLM